MSLRLAALLGGFLLPASGCQRQSPEPSPMSCSPADTSGAGARASAERLAGTFQLRLVATAGPRAGQTADGTLQLRPYDEALQEVTIGGIRDTAARYVHYGSADVDLPSVGAVRPGELGSTNPLEPGVAVVERKGSVVLRLGSDANRRDVRRFDGSYTALRVSEATGERFAGTWASGVRTQRSAGYFCAVRVEGN